MRQAKLQVEQRLDGTLMARWPLSVCPEPVPAQPEPERKTERHLAPKRGSMDGFWHGAPAKRTFYFADLGDHSTAATAC
jgi:hypothetical protein